MKYFFFTVLLFTFTFAQSQNTNFGKNRISSIHVFYLPVYENEKIIGNYIPLNINFLFSITKNIYSGIYYSAMSQRLDNYGSITQDIFHRGGLLLRYKESFLDERASFNMDVGFALSNFSVDPNSEHFIQHTNYQIGVNFLADFKIYKSLYLSGGFIGHRTLKKGDYGFEVFPMLGMNVQF